MIEKSEVKHYKYNLNLEIKENQLIMKNYKFMIKNLKQLVIKFALMKPKANNKR